MIAKPTVDLFDGTTCDMYETEGKKACTVDNLLNVIESFEGSSTHLLGWNEPYFEDHFGWIYPVDAARMWAKFLQPLAKETGLQLVSPTTNRQKTDWMANFIKACYANRNDEENPCDVNSIKKFSIHDYNCSENYWRRNYGGVHPKSFQQLLIKKLKVIEDPEINWTDYVNKRPLWVTETNCNWEGDTPDQE